MQEVPVVTSASGACCINTTMLMSMGLEKTLLENSPALSVHGSGAIELQFGDADFLATWVVGPPALLL